MDWLRSALTTNTYTHAYTSTPGENGEFENISQDTDCIGPPCRIRTCGLRLRRPLLVGRRALLGAACIQLSNASPQFRHTAKPKGVRNGNYQEA